MRSVAARLTFSYAAAFAASAAAGLLLVYLMTSAYLVHETDAELDYLHQEISSKFREMSPEAFGKDIHTETSARGTGQITVRIVSAAGVTVFSSGGRGWTGLPSPADVLELAAANRPVPKSRPRVVGAHGARMLYSLASDGHALEVGLSEKSHENFLRKLLAAEAVILVLMVAVGALVGWRMARGAVSGVEAVTSAAAEIAEGRFGGRVPLGRRGREIEELAASFNRMADRVQTLMAKMREVNDNIAHDLRSPITRMRCNAELPLLGEFSEEEYQKYAARIIEDCDRLLSMVNTMLDISEFEAGVARINLGDVDLAGLCRDGVELFEPVAETRGVSLRLESPPAARLRGDASLLQRVLANLLDNALKYVPEGGDVVVAVRERPDRLEVSVYNSGEGIPEAERSRVFERFFRGDRSRTHPGTGLGLSLARAVARAHGGDIVLEPGAAEGTTFTVSLPVEPKNPGI